ncbi:MAG: ClpXP protease specificity-enhancing factor SspB [Pseudomonadota bacterium]
MSKPPYEIWIDQALRRVVRQALVCAQQGQHAPPHYYLTVDVAAEGVDIPGFLRARYPDRITIVLQHQFTDLEVREEDFSVTLAFDGKPARLTVPFAALLSFVDPAAEFQIQLKRFTQSPEETGETDSVVVPSPETSVPITVTRSSNKQAKTPIKEPTEKSIEKPIEKKTQKRAARASATLPAPSADKVVNLEAFRKKDS